MDYLRVLEEASNAVDLQTLPGTLDDDLPNDPWSAIKRISEDCSNVQSNEKPKKKHLTPSKKAQVVGLVARMVSKKGRLSMEENSKIMTKFNVGPKYAKKLFNGFSKGVKVTRKQGSGRKSVITPEIQNQIELYLQERNYDATYREMEEDLGLAKTTIMRFMKNHRYRTCGKYLRPILTANQMEARLQWCQTHQFDSFCNTVDIDEKCMYAISNRGCLKVPPSHTPKRRPVKSKRFITKLMVLTAIAKPCQEFGFDGKVGIWCFAEKAKAKRSSKNRPKGSEILQPVEVTGDRWATMTTSCVFQAARKKMPWLSEINLQLDNARPHTKKNIQQKLSEAARNKRGEDGIQINICPQPVQSPDLNLNDLGFYASFDKHIGHSRSFDLGKWWMEIQRAFYEYPSHKLESLVATKQLIIKEILKCKGSNDYKLPHKSMKQGSGDE